MNLESLLEEMSEEEKAAFEKRLCILASTSGVGYQVVANLRCESRLDKLAFKDIVHGLLKAAANPEALKSAYIEKCRQHILEDGAIPEPRPLYLGRVVTPKRFYDMMVGLGYFRTEKQARDSFGQLFSKSFDAMRANLQNKFLGRFVMWATFNPEGEKGWPFADMPMDANGIRAHLGLNPNEKGKDLIYFVYVLPPKVEPLFPTIADAQWHLLFRPVPPGAKWGLTMPWPEIGEEVPRPEAVHEPIMGSTVEKIGLAKARA